MPATSTRDADQRNAALRRVIYDMMAAQKAVAMFPLGKTEEGKAVLKLTALIMARNLDEFFFKRTMESLSTTIKRERSDDIFVEHFDLKKFTPDVTAQLDQGPMKERQFMDDRKAGKHSKLTTKERIHKIAGHIACSDPPSFTVKEVREIVKRLIRQGCFFVRACLDEKKAEYTERAATYVKCLNELLRKNLRLPE